MKKKYFPIILLCIILVNVLLISENAVMVRCETVQTEISELENIVPYVEILEELNDEFDTNFAFPTNAVIERSGMNREQIIADILSTDIEDYEQLIRSEYANVNTNIQNNSVLSLTTQKAYYNGSTTNYVSISANTYYADGLMRYSTFDHYSYGYGSTPYYQPFVCSRSLTSNSTGYDCLFTCYKMLNTSVSYDAWAEHTLAALFTAGGGNTTATVLS